MEHREKANHAETFPPWSWPFVEPQLIEHTSALDQTHLVNGKGVSESTRDRLERSGGGKSYRCPHCRDGADKLGHPCGECDGKGVLYSFSNKKQRVDFATKECDQCGGSGQYSRDKNRQDGFEVPKMKDGVPVLDSEGNFVTSMGFRMFRDPFHATRGTTELAICLACVNRPKREGQTIERGAGYIDSYSAVPGPEAPALVTGGDSAQAALTLPAAVTLRRLAKVSDRAHKLVLLHWGTTGTECAEKRGLRDLVLWLGMAEGVAILKAYGDAKVVDPLDRMAKVLKTKTQDELRLHRIAQGQKRVADLVNHLKAQLWRADRQCGGGMMLEAARRAELRNG